MKLNFYQTLFLMLLSLLLAACADSEAATSEASIKVHPLFAKHGCIACHTVEPADGSQTVGPSLAGLATRSAQTIADPSYTGNAETVEAYLREAIMEPEIYIVAGYTPLMPKTYAASISEEELIELVNYLMTLQ